MDHEKEERPATTEQVTFRIEDQKGDAVSWVRGYDAGFECGRLAAFRDCITFSLAGIIVICVLGALGWWDRA